MLGIDCLHLLLELLTELVICLLILDSLDEIQEDFFPPFYLDFVVLDFWEAEDNSLEEEVALVFRLAISLYRVLKHKISEIAVHHFLEYF